MMEAAAVSSRCPCTPQWNLDRPFLTGNFHQEEKSTSVLAEAKGNSVDVCLESEKPIGCYNASLQEMLVIDDLLSALTGIDGRYISIKKSGGGEDAFSFHVEGSMDLALQESAKRIFPLCKSYLLINQFVESRSQFKSGLVNHAFAAALRALLLDYQAMVAQLEHQFRLGRLSIQGLWFYCQPMMGSMQALSIVIKKASAYNFVGSAVLNLLQSQAKLMAGNYLVRSLLEKMIDSANSAYLGILERWVYEGVIDDPHDEFFIAENKSLQKESLTQDYDAMYWRQRYSLKDDIPSFLANSAETILTTGKYLNVMRECGHTVQVPALENSKLTSFGSNDHYLECIKSAYDFASGELLNLMKDKYDLIGKLRSIKRYLLLDQGDFLVHFMDIARDELAKTPNEISVEKLQVLEPNWHVMHNKLENAKSIDEVIQYHDFFMEKCLKECSLLSPILLKKLEKLKLVCLQYAAATQWLMNSIEVPEDTDNPSYESCKVLLKLRKPSKKPNSPTQESSVIQCVLKFEREFTSELQSLRPILSSRAQAEPYLTHLAQLILGVGMDQQM